MKRTYIKPVSENLEIGTLDIIAVSPGLETGGTGGGPTGDGEIEESAGAARGNWGDVWGGK